MCIWFTMSHLIHLMHRIWFASDTKSFRHVFIVGYPFDHSLISICTSKSMSVNYFWNFFLCVKPRKYWCWQIFDQQIQHISKKKICLCEICFAIFVNTKRQSNDMKLPISPSTIALILMLISIVGTFTCLIQKDAIMMTFMFIIFCLSARIVSIDNN